MACKAAIRRNRDLTVDITLLILCILPVLASAFLTTDGTISIFRIFGFSIPIRSICLFRIATGYKCPVCGMTRCFIYISHFNFKAAYEMNPSGIPLYLLCVYEIFYRLSAIVSSKFESIRFFKIFERFLIVLVCVCVLAVFLIQFFTIL